MSLCGVHRWQGEAGQGPWAGRVYLIYYRFTQSSLGWVGSGCVRLKSGHVTLVLARSGYSRLVTVS